MECFYNQGVCITFSHIKSLYYDNDDTAEKNPPPVHRLLRFSHWEPGSRGICWCINYFTHLFANGHMPDKNPEVFDENA